MESNSNTDPITIFRQETLATYPGRRYPGWAWVIDVMKLDLNKVCENPMPDAHGCWMFLTDWQTGVRAIDPGTGMFAKVYHRWTKHEKEIVEEFLPYLEEA